MSILEKLFKSKPKHDGIRPFHASWDPARVRWTVREQGKKRILSDAELQRYLSDYQFRTARGLALAREFWSKKWMFRNGEIVEADPARPNETLAEKRP